MKSPIETKLFNALIAQADVASNDFMLWSHCHSVIPVSAIVREGRVDDMTCGDFDGDGTPTCFGDGSYYAALYRDVMVDRYRVDFLMWLDYGPTFIAIECDGHEWHERTKQQASADRARDRALLRVGIHTLRFTGSDIFHDAEACALEVIELAKTLANRSWFAGHERGWSDGYKAATKTASMPDGDL